MNIQFKVSIKRDSVFPPSHVLCIRCCAVSNWINAPIVMLCASAQEISSSATAVAIGDESISADLVPRACGIFLATGCAELESRDFRRTQCFAALHEKGLVCKNFLAKRAYKAYGYNVIGSYAACSGWNS